MAKIVEHGRRALSALLSLVLVAGLNPVVAVAQVSDGGKVADQPRNSLATGQASAYSAQEDAPIVESLSLTQMTGTWGSNLTWTYDEETETLTISGEGALAGGSHSSPSWEKYIGSISVSIVVISEGVTSIGDESFCGCSSLTSASLPSTLVSIGAEAFFCCKSLASVSIPEGLTDIGNDAFNGCKSLASVSLPSTLADIGDSAFRGCTSLASVFIPEGLTDIENYAFYGCTSLASVSLPSTLADIGPLAFENCPSLSFVYYAGGKSQWSSVSLHHRNDTLAFAENFYCSHVHDWYSEVSQAANCTEAGCVVRTCIYGDVWTTPTSAALGHQLSASPVSSMGPSCTEQGCDVYNCTRCGGDVLRPVSAALGHDYHIAAIEVAPTCEVAGQITYACSLCGNERSETVDPVGHNVVTVDAAEPTCFDAGHSAGTRCTRCGTWFVGGEDGREPFGHEYSGLTCVRCGELWGDVNANSVLNIVDAQIAYDLARGYYSDANNLSRMRLVADVVGGTDGSSDGTVDAQDAFRIQYVILHGA